MTETLTLFNKKNQNEDLIPNAISVCQVQYVCKTLCSYFQHSLRINSLPLNCSALLQAPESVPYGLNSRVPGYLGDCTSVYVMDPGGDQASVASTALTLLFRNSPHVLSTKLFMSTITIWRVIGVFAATQERITALFCREHFGRDTSSGM